MANLNCHIGTGGACGNIGLGTGVGGFWGCIGFGTGAGGFGSGTGFGTCSGGFCGCTGSGTCAGGFWSWTGRFGSGRRFGICAGRFDNGGGSGICAGGPGSGGFCGLGGAWFCTWSIGIITTSGSSGGFCFGRSFFGGIYCEGSFTFVWSVALVFVVLCIGGSFGAGSPFSAIWYLLTWFCPYNTYKSSFKSLFFSWLSCQVSFCPES